MNPNGLSGAELRLERLTKSYGSKNALDTIDLNITAGEFFTILGPSGSGKTTTLMLIAGFTEPSSGEIYINNKPVSRIPAHKRDIGVVFQNYGLFPHMSVARNIAFPLMLRGMEKSEMTDDINSILELVQLAEYQEHMPHQLSGGQQQRVALARALVYKPNVLLLDEPLSALDRNLREQMQIELKDLHQQFGITIVCVTHDQTEALALSDRVAVLNEGHLEQVGTPEKLYEYPNSRFVAGFIGESNIMQGRYVDHTDRYDSILLDDKLTVNAPRSNAFQNGMDVELFIRPQHVLIGEEALHAVNSFAGTVKNRIYSGNSLKLEIAIGNNLSVFARVQNIAIAYTTLLQGELINIGFKPEHLMIYPLQETTQGH